MTALHILECGQCFHTKSSPSQARYSIITHFPKDKKPNSLILTLSLLCFLIGLNLSFQSYFLPPQNSSYPTTTPISIPAYRTICISCNIPNFYLHSSISKYVCLENKYSKSQNYLKHLLLRDAFTDLPSKSFSP